MCDKHYLNPFCIYLAEKSHVPPKESVTLSPNHAKCFKRTNNHEYNPVFLSITARGKIIHSVIQMILTTLKTT